RLPNLALPRGCLVRTRKRRLAMPSGLHRIAGTLVVVGEGPACGDVAGISFQCTLEPTHSSGLLTVPHQDFSRLARKRGIVHLLTRFPNYCPKTIQVGLIALQLGELGLRFLILTETHQALVQAIVHVLL